MRPDRCHRFAGLLALALLASVLVGFAPSAAPPAQTLLIVPAGLLIAIPGLLTTALGLILWVPFVRARIAARIERAARRLGPPDMTA